jgi:hypothetical protein
VSRLVLPNSSLSLNDSNRACISTDQFSRGSQADYPTANHNNVVQRRRRSASGNSPQVHERDKRCFT